MALEGLGWRDIAIGALTIVSGLLGILFNRETKRVDGRIDRNEKSIESVHKRVDRVEDSIDELEKGVRGDIREVRDRVDAHHTAVMGELVKIAKRNGRG